jgi:pimeloyl-ACP methyl ester carboxylesterase
VIVRPALALAIFLALAAPAAAVDRYVPMKVPPGPGPAKYDRVFVQQLGPAGARNVLVLVPGTNGGAGAITAVARDIVRRAPSTQVWIVDRREQALEDTSVFASGDPQRAQDYYLGFQYRRVAGEDAKFVADWGLKLQLADLRSVIRRAGARGRRVILGGHSAGASTAVAYAAWDFAGHAGYRDLDGLVLIDGGLLGSFDSADLARAKRELADIRSGRVFYDVLELGLPEINGIFTEVAALWAYKRPSEPSVLQQYPLLPDSVKPPIRVTNKALFGFAFDEDTSPDFLSIIHLRAGRLADTAIRAAGGMASSPHFVFSCAPGRWRRRMRPSGITHAACCSTSMPPAPSGKPPRRAISACGCCTAARSTCRCTPSARR